MSNTLTSHERGRGAVLGQYIGDALAMPVHWVYDRAELYRQYGEVTDYLAPKNPHPNSILWRSEYHPPNEKGDILHEQAQFWGQQGVHYHQFLKAGENTLNLKLATLLIESMNELGRHDGEDFLARMIEFLLTPGNHKDTYAEEYLRHFFTQYAQGKAPRKCAMPAEKHIGGLHRMAPVLAFYADEPDAALQIALENLALTHGGGKMRQAGTLYGELLLTLMQGRPLKDTLEAAIDGQRSPFVGHPFRKWLKEPDDMVVEGRLSTACYVEYSLPAVIYLALKYHDEPERGLIVNTNLGGDNASRGVVLGALYGAAYGAEGFPEPWRTGLLNPPPELKERSNG
jgi:ADP-ribosylglycohydrolase